MFFWGPQVVMEGGGRSSEAPIPAFPHDVGEGDSLPPPRCGGGSGLGMNSSTGVGAAGEPPGARRAAGGEP